MYKNRGYKSFGTALIGAGTGGLILFFLLLNNSINNGDYLSLAVVFVISMMFIIPGVLIIRWAKKHGKK